MPARSRSPATQQHHAGHPAGRRRALPAASRRAAGPDSTPENCCRGNSSWRSATGAALWLTEAAAAGCSRIRAKMAEAVELAALHDAAAVDRALGPGRHRGPVRPRRPGRHPGPPGRRPRPTTAHRPARAGEHNSLAQGTARLGPAR